MRDNAGNILGIAKTEQTGPYAGGFVTSFSMTADGKAMVHGTDVGGGYVWGENDTRWRHVITYDSYPDLRNVPNSAAVSSGDGCYAIDIAPSNSQVGYFIFRGYLFRTTDQFHNVQMVPGGPYGAFANGGDHRLYTDKMKIDWVDPNTFVVGTEGTGAYYSIDGGLSVKKITGFPDVASGSNGVPYHISVACDPTGPVANGRKQRWAIFVPNSGIWMTTTGPEGTWSKLAGSPAWPVADYLHYDANGHLWVMYGKQLMRFKDNAWVTENINGFTPRSLAVCRNGQRVLVGPNGEYTWTAKNNPDKWIADTFNERYPNQNGFVYQAEDIRWLRNSYRSRIFPSKLFVDPIIDRKIWVVHGTGIAWFMLPDDIFMDPPAQIVYNDHSLGNAMLVTNVTQFTPDGRLIRGCWDKGVWAADTEEEMDNPPFPSPVGGDVQHGWDIDYIPGHPDWLVACINHTADLSGMSKDGGKTWTKFNNHPAGATAGGNIGFVTDMEGYWFPANNARAAYTMDGGVSWSFLDFTCADGSKMPTGGGQGWNFAYYIVKKNLLISKHEPGVAYAYNYGSDNNPKTQGIWRKEAGSNEFKQIHVGNPMGVNAWFHYWMGLTEMPTHPGYLLMKPGFTDVQARAVRSYDYGRTWSIINTRINGIGDEYPIIDMACVGYGKPAPGAAYAAVRFAGYINGQYGIWETLDNFVTTKFIEGHAMGYSQDISSVAGHPTKFGLWYYGASQLGWVKSERKHVLRFS